MKNIRLGLAMLIALTYSAFYSTTAAAQVDLKSDYPSQYTVKRGDTLWDISAMYLQSPWLWPEIWQVNPQVGNPHLIYPGDILKLVYIDGKPRLVVSRGEVKLTPHMRTSPLGAAISAIPAEVISSFLSRSRVLDKELLKNAPYVVAGSDHRLISGAGDRVYGRGNFDTAHDFYGIYRIGEEYRDPQTRERLGVQAVEIGTGRITATGEDVVTVALNSTSEEVRARDRFLPLATEELPATFYPKPPEGDVQGLIIAVEGGVANIGRFDVVTINRGQREGLQMGDVLAVNRAGERVRDPVKRGSVQLPSERAGLLMVFKVFEKVSYGLILEAERALSVMDEVANP